MFCFLFFFWVRAKFLFYFSTLQITWIQIKSQLYIFICQYIFDKLLQLFTPLKDKTPTEFSTNTIQRIPKNGWYHDFHNIGINISNHSAHCNHSLSISDCFDLKYPEILHHADYFHKRQKKVKYRLKFCLFIHSLV